jgi:hypothetical protein
VNIPKRPRRTNKAGSAEEEAGSPDRAERNRQAHFGSPGAGPTRKGKINLREEKKEQKKERKTAVAHRPGRAPRFAGTFPDTPTTRPQSLGAPIQLLHSLPPFHYSFPHSHNIPENITRAVFPILGRFHYHHHFIILYKNLIKNKRLSTTIQHYYYENSQ